MGEQMANSANPSALTTKDTKETLTGTHDGKWKCTSCLEATGVPSSVAGW